MSTAEMKQHVIERIQSLEDEDILQEIENLLTFHQDEEVFILSDEQMVSVNQGLKDFEDGNFLTNEEANKEIEEWLKK